MQIKIIGKNEAGQRLDKYLSKVLSKAPKSFLYKMLRKKNITLNGKKASGNEILAEEDTVKFFLSDETMDKFSREMFQKSVYEFPIVYENEHILVVNKPAGLLSQKQAAGDVSLVEQIISYLLDSHAITEEELRSFRPGICNRLDRNTSGLVLAGKTLEALQLLSQWLRERTVHKYYLCLVNGVMQSPRSVCGYLYKDEKQNKVTITKKPFPGALFIETEYEPLAHNEFCTLCKVLLVTGRTHQIRAHLAGIGHPIIGDVKYGNTSVNRRYKKKYRLQRQLLHAWRLEFPKLQPDKLNISGKCLLAPLPEDFTDVLKGEHIAEESIKNGGKKEEIHHA